MKRKEITAPQLLGAGGTIFTVIPMICMIINITKKKIMSTNTKPRLRGASADVCLDRVQ